MPIRLFLSVTFRMMTEYKMSGSTSVTSRDHGAVHQMITEIPFLRELKPLTADKGPEMGVPHAVTKVAQL